MALIVTGASGAFGRKATALLLETVPPSELILVTRNPASLAAMQARGAAVRAGDFDDPASLRRAFAGGERMLMISTLDVGRRAPQHRNAIEAAQAAGVRRLVYTSSDGMHPDNPAIIAPDHRATEAMLAASGLDTTIMRDSLYAETVTTMLGPVALTTGVWRSATQDGRVGFAAKADCVACAVAALLGEGHGGKTYAVTGPAAHSFRDAAAMVAEVTGRPVDYVPVSFEQLDKDLEAAGFPAVYEPGLNIGGNTSSRDDIVSYEKGIAQGFFAALSTDVRALLGREPQSLRSVIEENREEMLRAAS